MSIKEIESWKMSLKNRELQVYVGLDPGRTIFFLNSLVSFLVNGGAY